MNSEKKGIENFIIKIFPVLMHMYLTEKVELPEVFRSKLIHFIILMSRTISKYID